MDELFFDPNNSELGMISDSITLPTPLNLGTEITEEALNLPTIQPETEITEIVLPTAGQPDLTVSISSEASVTPGSDLSDIEVRVKNTGDAVALGTETSSSQGYMVDLLLSSDEKIPPGFATYSASYNEDVLLQGGRISNTPDLAPGEEKIFNVSAGIPADTPIGNYYLAAQVDAGQKITESNENNNVSLFQIEVEDNIEGKPDLVVSSFNTTGSASLRDDDLILPIEVVVENQGDGTANEPFKVAVEYTQEGQPSYVVAFTADDTDEVNPTTFYPFTENPLEPGETVTFTGKLIFADSSLAGETVSLEAIADSDSGDEFLPDYVRVEESNEDNNRSNSLEINLDTNSSESESLLIPVELGSVPKRPDSDSPTIVRERFVKVDFDDLPDQVGTQGETVAINLFEDTKVEVGIESIELSTDGEHLVYEGSVNGAKFSEVTLVKSLESNLIVGNIRVDDEYYQIRYVGEEIHTIREIDASEFPDGDEHDHDSDPEDLTSGDSETDPLSAADSEVDDGSLIDVMVAYTAETRAVEGGTTAMNAVITLAEAETNQGYEDSDVDQRIRIVHREEVDYTESGSSSTDLSRLRNTSDGFLDNLHTLRDEHSADMVSLFVNDFDACGRGYVMTTPSYSFESSGFSVVETGCATGYYSFAHELGHNQGAGHDVGNGNGSYPYSHGYVDPDREFRTIMAYNPSGGSYVPRINRWSNPDQTYNGDPIGVDGVSDNRRTLNENAIYTANWRHSNDNLANAEEIVGTSISTTALNVNGTEETGEINHAGNSGGKSVWWTWTAPSSGAFEINTAGSDFNTLLGVYTGSVPASLTEIASNDDVSGSDDTSRVSFNAIAGTTYKIAVDGYNGDGGNISLTLQPNESVDLFGRYFNVVQEPRNAGQNFDVQFRVENDQAGSAESFDVKFYLSTNDFISTFDRQLGSYTVPSLAGNSFTELLTTNLSLPPAGDSFWNTLEDGQYYIGMIVDGNNDVSESDETNNRNTGEFLDYDGVQINNTQLVDLSGQFFNVVQEPRNAGQSFDVNFQVRNDEVNSSGSFDVKFYLSTNNFISTGDRELGSYNVTNVAGNTTSSTLTRNLTLPGAGDSFWNSVGDGQYYIGMIVDADGDVSETDESNNRNTGEFLDSDGVRINNTQRKFVNLTINRLSEIDNIEPDFIINDDPDFYAVVNIDGQEFTSPIVEGSTITPNWNFSKQVIGSTVDINLAIYDKDHALRGNDDHVDINPLAGQKDLRLRYDLRTGSLISTDPIVAGAIAGTNTTIVTGEGDSDRGQIRYTVNIT